MIRIRCRITSESIIFCKLVRPNRGLDGFDCTTIRHHIADKRGGINYVHNGEQTGGNLIDVRIWYVQSCGKVVVQ